MQVSETQHLWTLVLVALGSCFSATINSVKVTAKGLEFNNRHAEQISLGIGANTIHASCVIVGAGPAGLSPLIAAVRSKRLQELLDAGIVLVDNSDQVGCGEIGRYAISSDSAAEAFLDAIAKSQYPEVAALWDHPIVHDLSRRIGEAVPLPIVAKFLALIGDCICGMVRSSPRGRVLLLHKALWTKQTSDGGWATCVQDQQSGAITTIISTSVVLATGAEQPVSRLHSEPVAGAPLLPKYSGKVMQSGFVLKPAGLREVRRVLQRYEDPRVVIVGGSTSAAAVARMLLGKKVKLPFSEGGVTILHRRPLRIFYSSAAAALEDGYTDFGQNDICPISGRVYRLAGFRLDSRELMMRTLRIGGREGEPRLALHRIHSENDSLTAELLDKAHLIIAAMGYRPRALRVLSVSGRELLLRCATTAMTAMVDEDSRVVDENGHAIEGLYGVGLAAGFVPSGSFGGEPSFQGQANSLWLWQHDVGEQIGDALLRLQQIRGGTHYASKTVQKPLSARERDEVIL